jgi:hypothetical protein
MYSIYEYNYNLTKGNSNYENKFMSFYTSKALFLNIGESAFGNDENQENVDSGVLLDNDSMFNFLIDKDNNIQKNLEEIPTSPTNLKNDKIKEMYTKCQDNLESFNDNSLLIGKKKSRKKKAYSPKNKFTDDNLKRKVKKLLFKYLFDFINEKIKLAYNNNIGKGMFRKELLNLNKEAKSSNKVKYNRELLKKSLKEIFREKISPKYSNYPEDHNKNLIEKLTKGEDEYNEYFKRLFNLKISDYLAHFNGSEKFKELEGMKTFEDIKDELQESEEYLKGLKNHIINFVKIINNKRERTSAKSKKRE